MAGDSTIRLHDADWVRGQYVATGRLVTRTSVWRASEGTTPQDVVLRALEGSTDVLEVGCGTDSLARPIRVQGHRVVASDASPAMASTAAASGVTTIAADVRNLPFADQSFDAVVAAWVLYHLVDVPAALEELRRVLRPGGSLVSVTVGGDHLADLWAAAGLCLAPPTFSRENGEGLLKDRFTRVRRTDLEAWADFPDREVALRYLESTGVQVVVGMDEAAFPMSVSGTPTVFVAARDA